MNKTFTFQDDLLIDYLKEGKVIALPTDTVYGLAIKADSSEGYKRLIEIKKRPFDKPIAVMFSKRQDYSEYVYTDDGIKRVISSFLPGALTLVLKAKENLPYKMDLGTGKIGMRISALKQLDDFIYKAGFPLQITSCNISGEKPLTSYEEVLSTFNDTEEIKAIVRGECESKIATTVIDFSSKRVCLLREGEIKFDDVIKVYKGGNI